jgi:peptide-methionine (S)-S-oxide reductase
VVRTRVGYAGGTTPDPTYRRIGDHTETVEIDYDPAVIGYEDLLEVFWAGHDAGHAAWSVQYRSAIFYRTEEERLAAEASKARAETARGRMSTSIEPLREFYRAEDYHQKYYLRSDRVLAAEFRTLYRDERRFADSTAAARVNGWLEGCGSPGAIERDMPRLGLSEAGLAELHRRVVTVNGAAGCGLPARSRAAG